MTGSASDTTVVVVLDSLFSFFSEDSCFPDIISFSFPFAIESAGLNKSVLNFSLSFNSLFLISAFVRLSATEIGPKGLFMPSFTPVSISEGAATFCSSSLTASFISMERTSMRSMTVEASALGISAFPSFQE